MTEPVLHPMTADRLADLTTLFETNRTTAGCWCMWFMIRAKDCQAGWGEGNRARFAEAARASPTPMGLLAYLDGEPAGWCAAGPRSRYARALGAPTLAGHDPAESDTVWLVPCFFVRRTSRRRGITRALLHGAAALATEHGASAIEGFPLAGDRRRSAGEGYLGVERVFAACGFSPVRRPSATRVVMRRELR